MISDKPSTYKHLIRILSTFKSDLPDLFSLLDPLIQTYGPAYQNLWEASPITCAMTGRIFNAVSRPNVVILDVSLRNLYFPIVL